MSSEKYTDIEEKRVWETICTLRQIRFAGELTQKGRGAIDIKEILLDAERLAKSPAPYLIALLQGGASSDMLDAWQEAQREMDIKYQAYPMIRRSPLGMPLVDVGRKIRIMSWSMDKEIGTDKLTEYFIRQEKLGDIRFEDLFDNRLGILAPLSTDILSAYLLSEFIRKHHSPQTPQVKPVLASTDLTAFTFPKDKRGVGVFAGLSRILAYVDANGMGNTRIALAAAAELEYPGKVIPTGPRYPIIGY